MFGRDRSERLNDVCKLKYTEEKVCSFEFCRCGYVNLDSCKRKFNQMLGSLLGVNEDDSVDVCAGTDSPARSPPDS
jgi:hypothetical protein